MVYENDKEYVEYVLKQILTGVTYAQAFKGRYNRFDIHYLPKKGNKERFMEIKHRNFPHNKYETTIIELDKYNAITASTKHITDVDLLIMFTDGYVLYTPKRLSDSLVKQTKKSCPDQYDTEHDKWCVKDKDVVELRIIENFFTPYD